MRDIPNNRAFNGLESGCGHQAENQGNGIKIVEITAQNAA